MKQKQYIVDAFTDKIFEGNPAAVCIMEEWLPDDVMQKIAIENNLSETAFAVKKDDGYQLRWFTPGKEVDLCGHATLGTAFVLANFYDVGATDFVFHTLSGRLDVKKNGELFEMDFPARMPERIDVTKEMIDALGEEPGEAYLSRDVMLVFDNEEFVKKYNPNWTKLCSIQEGMGVLITARQVSKRGGTLFCEEQGDRVLIKGKVALYSEAFIYMPI